MNFDFLKDLRGLNYVYENCSNAEKQYGRQAELQSKAKKPECFERI